MLEPDPTPPIGAKTPKTRRSRKGRQRRDLLLDATILIAAERGLDHATIGAVASAAASPKSVVLYHFRTREGLLAGAVRHAIARLLAARQQHIAIVGEDPREQLRAWITSIFEQPEILQAWCLLAQTTARTSPGAGLDEIHQFEAENIAAMTALLQRGNDEFCWQIPSAKNAARSVLSMLDGMRLAVLRDGFSADLERAAADCRRAVLDHLVR